MTKPLAAVDTLKKLFGKHSFFSGTTAATVVNSLLHLLLRSWDTAPGNQVVSSHDDVIQCNISSQTCDIQMERGVRRLLLKNVQLEQAGEVSYQALNAVTSAMLNVKGEWSRSRTTPFVTSCENKGARCGKGRAIKIISHLRCLFQRFYSISDTKTPFLATVLGCVFLFVGLSSHLSVLWMFTVCGTSSGQFLAFRR